MSRRSDSFFLSVVEPTVREYLDDVGDIRRGRLAAIVLNHLADYWAADENIESPSTLRVRLQQECPLYSVIRDLSDASKHVKISRQNRVLSDEGQLSRPLGLFQAPFGTGVFTEASMATVTLDDGRTLPLADAVRAVLLMWEQKLGRQ